MSTAVSAWSDLMRQSISVSAPGLPDDYGAKTYAAPVSYQCRIVGKVKSVINVRGETVVSQQTCYLMTADAIDPESQVTLSTDDVGSTQAQKIHPSIVATGRYPDENGAHHSVIYL